MDAEMETHKKNLDKLIPELNNAVHELTEDCQQPQYLDKNSDMTEMIKLLDEKWEKFEEYRDMLAEQLSEIYDEDPEEKKKEKERKAAAAAKAEVEA